MSSFVCKKTYRIEYAHQLFDSYTTLCHETIHGHSGKIELVLKSANSNVQLDPNGMVIDFGEVSDFIKPAIMEKYDHALFMPCMFPKSYLDTLEQYNKRLTITVENPTAENFAKMIYDDVSALLKLRNTTKRDGTAIVLESVTFWETETGCATYCPED